MKKVLSTVAALGLVVGFAATASALDVPDKVKTDTAPLAGIAGEHFGVTGSWSIAGVTLNNAKAIGAGGYAELNSDTASDSFYINSFILDPTLRVNDKVQVKGQVRIADRDIFGATAQKSTSGDYVVDFRQIYLEYASPVGRIQAGRMAAGAWGSSFLNSSTEAARIRWYPSFVSSPWSLLLFVQQGEADYMSGTSDNDANGYYAGVTHKGDMGQTDVALYVARDGASFAGADASYTNQIWVNANYKIEGISVLAELNYVFGENNSGATTVDNSAFGFTIDVGMKAGEADLGLMYAYASGDDAVDNDQEAMMAFTKGKGLGADYNPFDILTGDYTGILNGDKNTIQVAAADGASLIAVHGKMKVNDKLTVNGTIGTGWANEGSGDDEFGWEVDLGASYALYDNLSYGVHFGYLATGDYFDSGSGTEDVIQLSHQLTMKF